MLELPKPLDKDCAGAYIMCISPRLGGGPKQTHSDVHRSRIPCLIILHCSLHKLGCLPPSSHDLAFSGILCVFMTDTIRGDGLTRLEKALA